MGMTEERGVVMRIGFAALCLLFAVQRGIAQPQDDMPLVDLRSPLDYHENGKIKTQMFAARAKVPEEGGAVLAVGVRVEMYGEGGETETVVTAEECTFDRETKRVRSRSRVSLSSEGLTITGKGLDWKNDEQTVTILEDAVVTMSGKLPLKQRLGGLSGGT